MCYTIPILKTEDEFFDDDEDAKSVNEVEDVPQGLSIGSKTIRSASTKPRSVERHLTSLLTIRRSLKIY